MKAKLIVSLASALALVIFAAGDARALGAGKTCGGIVAQTCNAGLFCQYQPGECGKSDAKGACTKVPRSCPRLVRPVCGCNNVTYNNDCERQQAATSKAHDGACN